MKWSIRRWRWGRGDRLEHLVDVALEASPGLVRGYTFTATDLRTDMRYALLGVLPMMSRRYARAAWLTSGSVEEAPPVDRARNRHPPDLATLGEDPRNRFAVAALQAAVLRPGRDMNPIVIYGARGGGKTAVLDACRRQAQECGYEAALLDASYLKRVVVGASSDNGHHCRLRQLASADFLLVDGIDALALFPASARDVLDALTATIAVGQQVVVTATSREFGLLRTWAGDHKRALVTDVATGSATKDTLVTPGEAG